MSIKSKSRTQFQMLAVALAMTFLWSSPVLANNKVALTIVGSGSFEAGIVDASLLQIEYSEEPQVDTGALHLLISDPRGTSEGWSVSIASSDFIYLGDSLIGLDIPSSGFRIGAVSAPELIAGQPLFAAGPNFDALPGASLDTARTVVWAEIGSGSGEYEQFITVVLDIPSGSQAGTYLATLTVSLTSAP